MKGGAIGLAVTFFVLTILMALSVRPTEVLALEGEIEGETLAGVPAMAVMVMPAGPEGERNGLKWQQIREDAKSKLRKAGIKVLTDREMENPGFPYLELNVHLEKDKNPQLYSYGVKAEFYRLYVINPEDAKEHPGFAIFQTVKTWATESKGTAPGTDVKNSVQKQIDDLTDKFITIFLAANPKEGSKP